MAKAIITEVYTDGFNKYHVVYASGRERVYNWRADLPETARKWLKAHEEPEPEKVGHITVTEPDPDEYRKIQDSMTESFYEFCTGDPIPENWKEVVAEENERLDSTQPIPDLPPTGSRVVPDLFPVPSQIILPALIKSGPSAVEAIGFGICMALAYTAWIAKGAAELLILALQVLYITLSPIVCEASERLWIAWVKIYPEIVPTARKTAKITAKQVAMMLWWLWIVIA